VLYLLLLLAYCSTACAVDCVACSLLYRGASQVKEFRVAFTLFDRDGGGSIDAGELGTVIRHLGKTSEHILLELGCGWGSVPLLLRTTAYPLYTRFTNMFGAPVPDATIPLGPRFSAHPTEAQLKAMVDDVDADGSGAISHERVCHSKSAHLHRRVLEDTNDHSCD
jgi:hypothetical protein